MGYESGYLLLYGTETEIQGFFAWVVIISQALAHLTLTYPILPPCLSLVYLLARELAL